jgi:CBS domain-containing protein
MEERGKKVRDIMSRIEEYNMVQADARLCDALFVLKQNHEKIKAAVPGKYHKTLIVTEASGKILGKLSIFDIIRGLVPESAKAPLQARRHQPILSARAMAVEREVAEAQERFQWFSTTFLDLVKQETQKRIKDVMSPLQPLLVEEDSINKAIYVMFKENIRQPAVAREGKIIGIVSLMDIFPELLNVAGDVCAIA